MRGDAPQLKARGALCFVSWSFHFALDYLKDRLHFVLASGWARIFNSNFQHALPCRLAYLVGVNLKFGVTSAHRCLTIWWVIHSPLTATTGVLCFTALCKNDNDKSSASTADQS